LIVEITVNPFSTCAGEGKAGAAKDAKAKGKQAVKTAGWLVTKYKAARHAARGVFNRTLRVRNIVIADTIQYDTPSRLKPASSTQHKQEFCRLSAVCLSRC
jgi:hypothetical protein